MKNSRLSPSRMRSRVSVQALTRVATGSFNETKQTWATVATRWAEVLPAAGTETDIGPQQVAGSVYKVRMMYYPGLDAVNYRLLYEGVVLNILNVNNVEQRNWEMALACKAVYGET